MAFLTEHMDFINMFTVTHFIIEVESLVQYRTSYHTYSSGWKLQSDQLLQSEILRMRWRMLLSFLHIFFNARHMSEFYAKPVHWSISSRFPSTYRFLWHPIRIFLDSITTPLLKSEFLITVYFAENMISSTFVSPHIPSERGACICRTGSLKTLCGALSTNHSFPSIVSRLWKLELHVLQIPTTSLLLGQHSTVGHHSIDLLGRQTAVTKFVSVYVSNQTTLAKNVAILNHLIIR